MNLSFIWVFPLLKLLNCDSVLLAPPGENIPSANSLSAVQHAASKGSFPTVACKTEKGAWKGLKMTGRSTKIENKELTGKERQSNNRGRAVNPVCLSSSGRCLGLCISGHPLGGHRALLSVCNEMENNSSAAIAFFPLMRCSLNCQHDSCLI